MSLTAKDVAQITRLLEESSFDELYLELDGLKLSLRRGSAANGRSLADAASAGTATVATSVLGPTAAAAGAGVSGPAGVSGHSFPAARPAPADAMAVPPQVTDPNTATVSAPLLGTFYRAPKPGAPPFVDIGTRVEEDTIVGIIEVMKLMNTVRAGVRGKVVQILASDGALVEYGETLLHVSKTS